MAVFVTVSSNAASAMFVKSSPANQLSPAKITPLNSLLVVSAIVVSAVVVSAVVVSAVVVSAVVSFKKDCTYCVYRSLGLSAM